MTIDHLTSQNQKGLLKSKDTYQDKCWDIVLINDKIYAKYNTPLQIYYRTYKII